MFQLRYLPSFRTDLEAIWLYIAADSPDAADRLIDRLYNRVRLLSDFPEAGPVYAEIAPDCRLLVEGNYLILYRIAENAVELVRALEGHRRLSPSLFDERG